jgi:hypothetical protein
MIILCLAVVDSYRYWLIVTSVAPMVAGKLIIDGMPMVGPVKLTETDTAVPCARGVVVGLIVT